MQAIALSSRSEIFEIFRTVYRKYAVLAGAQDSMPVERTEEIHAGIPNSMFKVFERSGHFAPIEQPESFEPTVLGFLGVKP